MTDLLRVAAAARVFTLAVIGSTALVGNVDLDGVWFVAAIAVTAGGVSATRLAPERLVVLGEAAVTAVVAVWAFPQHEAAMPYLAIPALIGGVAVGLSWVAAVLLVEAAAMGSAAVLLVESPEGDVAGTAVTWLATGLGLGLLGTFTRRTLTTPSAEESYRSALGLIRGLQSLSEQLTAGLDPVDLADQALAVVSEEVVVRQAAVVVPHGSGFTPLRFSTGSVPFPLDDVLDQVRTCWEHQRPVLGESRTAVPMSTGSERVAVVLLDCPTAPSGAALDRIVERLRSCAVQLSAAMLFASVHENATAQERRRLAREVHDGVAQDVASLGYLVDNLAATSTDPDQAAEVALLRAEVTRVVAELRNSVFDLRNETAPGQGLGESIALFARHIGSHSDLTVHVTLDESSGRLRPLVEAELLRIAQEAINNARRHSGGENLWVRCRVLPPHAEIDVTDDGCGLGEGREDSHGLRIMSERAERIGATITIETPVLGEGSAPDRGTRVSVRLG